MPLIKNIDYRHHIHSRAILISCVHIIIESDEADVVRWENIIHILPDLDIVSAETGEVFADYQIDLSVLRILQKLGDSRTVDVCSGIPVINININQSPMFLAEVSFVLLSRICAGIVVL